MATARFLQLEKQLSKNDDLAAQYKKFMEEYKQLGHMQKIVNTSTAGPIYYMPHHAVLKPSSSTTKLRVVFDASAKTTNGRSLNDIMHVGPKLQQDLWHIVMRWRKHKYVFTADIEKMFRQIWIAPEDRNFQRILWRDSPADKLQDYQLKTVTYGTASATYLAVRTLQQLAEDEKKSFPSAYQVVKSDFYVDDLMTGCDTVKEALLIQNQLRQLLQRGGFNLRKWTSNNKALLSNVTETGSTDVYKFKIDETVKALGLYWKPCTDVFEFKVDLPVHTGLVTKRIILSTTAKLFDPVGWLAPIIITPKITMQKLWLLGLSWDEPVSEEIARQWVIYTEELTMLNKLKIPRWTGFSSKSIVEVHGFSDASEQAYAACVYLKVVTEEQVCISLIAAKTRVAPTKQNVTLPPSTALSIQQAPTYA